MSPAQRRDAAQFLIEHGLSQRRSCALAGISRSAWRYQPQARDEAAVIERLREIARANKRYGYRRAAVLLRREQKVGHSSRSRSRTVELTVDTGSFLAWRLGLSAGPSAASEPVAHLPSDRRRVDTAPRGAYGARESLEGENRWSK